MINKIAILDGRKGGTVCGVVAFDGRREHGLSTLRIIQPTEVALNLDVLAVIETQAGRYAEAEPHFRRALILREESLPADHLEIAEVRDHYAAFLRKAGRVDEAEAMARRAQQTRDERKSRAK